MNRYMMLVGRAAGRGAFKGAALIGAFAIIGAAWWWDASLLTAAADHNLRLIKIVIGALPHAVITCELVIPADLFERLAAQVGW